MDADLENSSVMFESAEEEIISLLMYQASGPTMVESSKEKSDESQPIINCGELIELHDQKSDFCVSTGERWLYQFYPTFQEKAFGDRIGWRISCLGMEQAKLEIGMIVRLERPVDSSFLRAWRTPYVHTSKFIDGWAPCYQWRLIAFQPETSQTHLRYGTTVYLMNIFYKQFLAIGSDPRFMTTVADRRKACAFTIKRHLPLTQSIYDLELEEKTKKFEKELTKQFEQQLEVEKQKICSSAEASRVTLEQEFHAESLRVQTELEATRVDGERKRQQLQEELERMAEQTRMLQQEEHEKRSRLGLELENEKSRLLKEVEATKELEQARRRELEEKLDEERTRLRKEMEIVRVTEDAKRRALEAELAGEHKRLLHIAKHAEEQKGKADKAWTEVVAEFDGLRMCLVCEEKERCRRLDPCGHICVCADCSLTAPLGIGGDCPICRQKIKNIQQAFL
eukprot:gb/GEZN01006166.1/.p1 GENE.gb/GEZN01006166.1/~~gb/GEZN01006166.1/.p1  ORF type:complete len:453 (-),score=77.99 gb/GEZN01006166.1/:247-1605(-)